jgi:hypothetical protein
MNSTGSAGVQQPVTQTVTQPVVQNKVPAMTNPSNVSGGFGLNTTGGSNGNGTLPGLGDLIKSIAGGMPQGPAQEQPQGSAQGQDQSQSLWQKLLQQSKDAFANFNSGGSPNWAYLLGSLGSAISGPGTIGAGAGDLAKNMAVNKMYSNALNQMGQQSPFLLGR